MISLHFSCFLSFLLVFSFILTCHGMDNDLTVEVQPGETQCFHQYLKESTNFEIEYQVIEGGELDITFLAYNPQRRALLTEIRRTDGIHSMVAKLDGEYTFCLDNTFSRFSKKLVFFEIITDDPDQDWEDLEGFEDGDYENTYEMKLEDMRAYLDKVKEHLDKSQQTQNVLRVFESRDRSIQESNFERVNTLSVVVVIVMLVTGLVQVLLIRSLFDDRGKLNKIFKMRT